MKLTGIVAEQGFVAADRSLWPFARIGFGVVLAVLAATVRLTAVVSRRGAKADCQATRRQAWNGQMRLLAQEIKPLAARCFPFAFGGNVT